MAARIITSTGTINIDVLQDNGQTMDPPTLAFDEFTRKGLDNTARLAGGKREIRRTVQIIKYHDDAADAEDYRDSLTELVNTEVSFVNNFDRRWNDVWVVAVEHQDERSVIRVLSSSDVKIRTVSRITLARTTSTQSVSG